MTNNKTNLIQKIGFYFFTKNQLSALRLVTIGVLVIGADKENRTLIFRLEV